MSNTQTNPPVIRATNTNEETHPDLDGVQSIVISDKPRTRKIATWARIKSRHTGESHHGSLGIKTLRKTKNTPFKPDLIHSITLVDKEEDSEVERLLGFLTTVRKLEKPNESTNFLLMKANQNISDPQQIQKIISNLSNETKIDTLVKILDLFSNESELISALIDRITQNPEIFQEAITAINLAKYKNSVQKLIHLVNSNAKEAEFQNLLQENPWMFGSEYSELLSRRNWTQNQQKDFVVRRTTDNFIEIIEIKTPLNGTVLFNPDRSHDCFYPGVELAKVLGQVENYLEKFDADRHRIQTENNEDVRKIRAKIIIGRDHSKEQTDALRRFNGHLYRIEIITFDQLINIANNVVKYLGNLVVPSNQSQS